MVFSGNHHYADDRPGIVAESAVRDDHRPPPYEGELRPHPQSVSAACNWLARGRVAASRVLGKRYHITVEKALRRVGNATAARPLPNSARWPISAGMILRHTFASRLPRRAIARTRSGSHGPSGHPVGGRARGPIGSAKRAP
jgi:hypothetical protein